MAIGAQNSVGTWRHGPAAQGPNPAESVAIEAGMLHKAKAIAKMWSHQ